MSDRKRPMTAAAGGVMGIRILIGDALTQLQALPAESVHCVVTSPPYFGLRDYGVAGQIGLEASPDEYVVALVDVFREVRRVLRSDGTVWLNLGDSYAGGGGFCSTAPSTAHSKSGKYGTAGAAMKSVGKVDGIKSKDIIGIPWLVAFALRADGWYLRQDIIWHKPNPMPESVTDRCTKAHEYIFLMSKGPRYYFDAEVIKESSAKFQNEGPRQRTKQDGEGFDDAKRRGFGNQCEVTETRNKRSVWTVATQPYAGAHFATFPPDLIEPCILAGTSERGVCAECGAPWVRTLEVENDARRTYATVAAGAKASEVRNDGKGFNKVLREDGRGGDLATKRRTTTGWQPSCSCGAAVVPATVLDPFFGAGTTGLVADRLGRDCIGIELNPQYAELARRRIADDAGMFAMVAAQ